MSKIVHASTKILATDTTDGEKHLLTLMQYESGQYKLFDTNSGNRHFDETLSAHPLKRGVYLGNSLKNELSKKLKNNKIVSRIDNMLNSGVSDEHIIDEIVERILE